MYIGAHVSIAGGLQNAPKNASALECECFQIFTRSPQGGPAPSISEKIISEFLSNCKKNNIKEWVVHAPYYINLASPLQKIRSNSIEIIRNELERASLIKASYVMFHIGSAKGLTRNQAMKYVVDCMKRILDGYKGDSELLIEISAGAGEIIGDNFEEIAYILDHVGEKVGVCFDTQHAFGSGYDLRTTQAVKDTFDLFDKIIGIEKLKMSHCNDSKVNLGEHKDRHEHIGEGQIGLEGFKALFVEKTLKHINWYLETEHDKIKKDIKILKEIRKN